MKQENLGKLPDDGFVRQSQLIPHIVPVSPATFWRMVKAGDFPAPIPLSSRITVWSAKAVREWMSHKQAQ